MRHSSPGCSFVGISSNKTLVSIFILTLLIMYVIMYILKLVVRVLSWKLNVDESNG